MPLVGPKLDLVLLNSRVVSANFLSIVSTLRADGPTLHADGPRLPLYDPYLAVTCVLAPQCFPPAYFLSPPIRILVSISNSSIPL